MPLKRVREPAQPQRQQQAGPASKKRRRRSGGGGGGEAAEDEGFCTGCGVRLPPPPPDHPGDHVLAGSRHPVIVGGVGPRPPVGQPPPPPPPPPTPGGAAAGPPPAASASLQVGSSLDKENSEPAEALRQLREEQRNLQMERRRRQVAKAKRSVLDQITEKSMPMSLVGLDNEFNQLFDLLDRTLKRGESNSCLVFGARGTGKTMLIRRALEKLSAERAAESGLIPPAKRFLKVQLSGLAQTEDRLALREVARQLALEVDADSEEITKTSFAQALTHLLSVFRSSGRDAVPVIFVLDEFDLFAEQPRQSLLYTLFDICQGEESPIAVIGATCRVDALELLEKRVKSRFSHRHIRLSPPANFEEYKTIAVNALMLRPEHDDDVEYFTEFNKRVSEAFNHQRLQGVTRRLYDRDKSVRALFKAFIDPVCALTPDKPFLDVEAICTSDARQRADAKTELLLGVSILELQLIIAMKRHYELEVMAFNFEMVYDEYKDFMDRAQASGSVGLKRATKPVAMKAFEHLQSFELVCPVESASRCPKEYRMVRLLLEPAQVVETVMRHPDCPLQVQKWATNWLPAS